MTGYRIRFLNDLPDSTGHVHTCCQRTVEIDAARADDAVADAQAVFERLEEIQDWKLRADRTECSALGAKITLEESLAK